MRYCRRLLALCAVLLAGASLGATPTSAGTCDSLAAVAFSHTTINAVQLVTSGSFDPPGTTPPVTNLPPFCRVSLTVDPQITVDVWLPVTWNQRFQAVGGGGYAGVISWAALGTALRAGYATASTDTGHDATVTPGGSFALEPNGRLNNGLITDFASRSLHEMTVKAKTLVQQFYGMAPVYSYWNGCSTGGRQGLMEAQRFASDYDGILSGAPAINWDRFIPSELWPQIVMHQEVGQPIAACKLTTVTSAAVAACDGQDGVVDGVIDDPRQCHFDPQALQCAPGVDDCTCLTPGEVTAVQKIWDGPRSSRSDRRSWYGLEPGASFAGLAGPVPFSITVDHFRYWLEQDPSFDWHAVDYAGFDAEFTRSMSLFHDVIGTDDPNLTRFSRAGKLIIWHGWADQLIPPLGTIDYWQRVLTKNGGPGHVDDFARLFMAPGVAHCGGGVGPNVFDVFGALVDWVEHGQAPDRIIASSIQGGQIVRTRPLCPYPEVARWTGTGNTNAAANFVCQEE